jgi:hypothetical protein
MTNKDLYNYDIKNDKIYNDVNNGINNAFICLQTRVVVKQCKRLYLMDNKECKHYGNEL